MASVTVFSQEKAKDQKHRVSQYIVNWFSADAINDTELSANPNIMMNVVPKLDGNSLQVEVFENRKNKRVSILVELISYDKITDQIVASGQNANFECFVGTGFFDANNIWQMQDYYHNGEVGLNITFKFISNTEVVLKGVMQNPDNNWKIKYIKSISKK